MEQTLPEDVDSTVSSGFKPSNSQGEDVESKGENSILLPSNKENDVNDVTRIPEIKLYDNGALPIKTAKNLLDGNQPSSLFSSNVSLAELSRSQNKMAASRAELTVIGSDILASKCSLNNIVDEADADRKDIDSGWAWVVLLAAYINLFLISGVCYMGGMFNVVFLEQFDESVACTAWVTALFSSLMMLAGPLTSVITSYSNCRVSVMAGGVLLSIGLAASSFVSSLDAMFVTFGIISGLGLGLSYTPSIVVVNFYFVKRRTLVTSVALSASGTGLMLAPLLLQFMLEHFAWRECLMILSGVCIHITLFGALMFPLHEKRSKIRLCTSCRKKKNLENVDDLASSQLLNGHQNQDVSLDSKTNGDVTVKRRSRSEGEHNSESQLDIFKNWAFLLFCLNQFLSNASCGIFNIHLPALCESYGSTASQIAVILSVNGPANIVSRVLLGAFAHASEENVWILYFGVLLVSGIIFCLMPIIARSYLTQLITVILIGTYLGGSYSLPPVLTIECVGLKRLAAAFGITLICGGIAWLIAPPIAGWFVDVTGSYDYSMYLAGIMMLISVLVGLMVPQMVKPENHQQLQGPAEVTIDVQCPEKQKMSEEV